MNENNTKFWVYKNISGTKQLVMNQGEFEPDQELKSEEPLDLNAQLWKLIDQPKMENNKMVGVEEDVQPARAKSSNNKGVES